MTEEEKVLPSERNQDWKKKVKLETRKVNKLLEHISTDNITDLNHQIYVVYDNISIWIKNPKKNKETKTG